MCAVCLTLAILLLLLLRLADGCAVRRRALLLQCVCSPGLAPLGSVSPRPFEPRLIPGGRLTRQYHLLVSLMFLVGNKTSLLNSRPLDVLRNRRCLINAPPSSLLWNQSSVSPPAWITFSNMAFLLLVRLVLLDWVDIYKIGAVIVTGSVTINGYSIFLRKP